jgi:ribosomal protein L10
MSKTLKHMMGREIADSLRPFDSCVVIGLEKLDVESGNRLRGKLADEKARLRIVHNRVSRHALEELGWDGLSSLLVGSTAIAYGEEGAIPISRVLVDWEKRRSPSSSRAASWRARSSTWTACAVSRRSRIARRSCRRSWRESRDRSAGSLGA